MKPPLDAELNALVDARIDPARAAEIEVWLAAHPAEAARVEGWRAQKEALHAAFDTCLDEPVPQRLRDAAAGKARQRWFPQMAAALAWLTLGGVIGFALHGAMPAERAGDSASSLPRRAAIAHVVYAPEVRHPVEVGAAQEEHLVQWLSKRLGQPLLIPRLEAQGFSLIGGRLLPGERGPVAQFMYQDGSGLRLTLYVRQDAANRETAFRFAREGGVSVFYWLDGPLGYALSGELPRERLLAVAEAVYRQTGGH
jgi:anti-sigma factor RsiW